MKLTTSVVVTDNTDIVRRNMRSRIANGLNEMSNQVIRISNPKTPKKIGKLRKNIVKKLVSDYERQVVWKQPYAAVQERGIRKGSRRFRNYTTPGTGAKFAENAKNEVEKNAARYFK